MVGTLGSRLDSNTSDIWTYQQLQRYMANQGDGADGLHGDITSFAWWQWASVASDTGGILQVGCSKSSSAVDAAPPCSFAQAAGHCAGQLYLFWLRTLHSFLLHELLAGGSEPAIHGALPATCRWAAAMICCGLVAAGRVSMLRCFALG